MPAKGQKYDDKMRKKKRRPRKDIPEATLREGDDVGDKIESLFGDMERKYTRREYDLAKETNASLTHDVMEPEKKARYKKKMSKISRSAIKTAYGKNNPAQRGKNSRSGF